MKMTYTVEPNTTEPGMLDLRLKLDDGEPLQLDVLQTMPPHLVEANLACVSATLVRWWKRVTTKENGDGE